MVYHCCLFFVILWSLTIVVRVVNHCSERYVCSVLFNLMLPLIVDSMLRGVPLFTIVYQCKPLFLVVKQIAFVETCSAFTVSNYQC